MTLLAERPPLIDLSAVDEATIARFPPFPQTERQAHVIALGERLGRVAAAQADAHDKAKTFPHDTFAALREAGYLAL
ncbi:MAG: hypothetical protein ACTHQE_00445, partial [Thermomicrobiales bacterium]